MPSPVSLARPRLAAHGAFEGYASLFGAEDQSRDLVMPGAFRASLARRGAQNIRMLFQHDPAEPIGAWDEIREDARGLYVRGRLIEGVARAREILALLREGAIDGLSIGFRAQKALRDARTGQRRLVEIDLWEVSIVTFPMLPGARVSAVKRGAPSAGSPARPCRTLAAFSPALSAGPSGRPGSRPAALSPARRETRPGGGLRLARP
ncbi:MULTISPECIES: HK97 family phage prohead protease [Rhodomicrobium]|uniref:HK97 family phage prohead protease n=1 Tax=Rhodomicrobium TaxID=1068 RepID=UPI001481F907|nr:MULTISPECIES: HK97 family phage prohead protease [Rhodomicrobium]